MTPDQIIEKVEAYARKLGIDAPDVHIKSSGIIGCGTVFITSLTVRGIAWACRDFNADSLQERIIGRMALKAGLRAADAVHAHVSTKH